MIHIKRFVKQAITEDNGRGDLFYDIAPDGKFTAKIVSKSNGILAGVKYAETLAQTEKIKVDFLKKDGDKIQAGDILAKLEGKASKLLSSERTFLNMLQHASGIATMASKFVEKLDGFDVVLLDTAGRLAIDEELMNELKEIKNAVNPNEIFYVADSLTGHDATKTAITFKEKIGIDGVILSKYDGDTKGGVALSIASQVQVPLRFIGIGEKMPDLEVFIPDRIVSRLLGLGDIAGLAEKTSTIFDEKKAKEVSKKIKKGEFNFNDFLEQLQMMSKLGSLKSIIGMIPGLSSALPALKDMDFENSVEIKRIKALIGSMTPKERENPDLLNPSRKKRISSGAGLSEVQVNKILKQFKSASKMAKQLSSKGGMKGLHNMLSQVGANGMPKIPR